MSLTSIHCTKMGKLKSYNFNYCIGFDKNEGKKIGQASGQKLFVQLPVQRQALYLKQLLSKNTD